MMGEMHAHSVEPKTRRTRSALDATPSGIVAMLAKGDIGTSIWTSVKKPNLSTSFVRTDPFALPPFSV